MNQKGKYNYLAKNTFLFTISNFGSKLLVVLLVPLYTSILSTEDYGIVDLITTTSSLLIYVFTINIQDAVLRFAIDQKKDKEKYLSYGIYILLIGSILFAITILVSWKCRVFKWENYCYLFLFLNFFFVALYHILSNYLRAIDKVKQVAVAGIIMTAVTVGLNILLLVVVNLGIIGYLVAMVAGAVAAVIYCRTEIEIKPFQIFRNRCDEQSRKAMRSFSIPLIFNGVAWWMNNSIDKYFVVAICGAAANGIYAVSYKIPTILTVFHTIFSQAWNLSAIKEFDRNDSDGFFSNTYTLYNAALVIICSGLILINIPLARVLFAKDFFVAWEFSSVLLISIIFSALAGFLGSIFTAVKDSKIFAVSTVISATLNCILNAILIPTMGVQGAAIATVFSFFMIWLIRLLCTRKYIKWHINLLRDVVAYILLIIQVVIEHTAGHAYAGQVVIIMILFIIYWDQVMKVISTMINICRNILSKK